MTITNHLLAGSLIGLAIKEPILAIALALASHFVMDALPHFGYPGKKGYSEVLKHRLTYVVSTVTLITSIVVVIWLLAHGEYFALGMGLVAASPDIVGLYNYLAYEKYGKKSTGLLKLIHVDFHRQIQWCERPWGIWMEGVVFAGLATVLLSLT